MKRIVAISLLLILSGCAVSPTTRIQGELPVITDNEMAGKVVVVRKSSPFGVQASWDIVLDGKTSFYLGSGEYTEFLLPEGRHYITLECFVGCVSLSFGPPRLDTAYFDLKASQTIYFLISPAFLRGSGGKISLSNEAEAKKHIARGKFINLEN